MKNTKEIRSQKKSVKRKKETIGPSGKKLMKTLMKELSIITYCQSKLDLIILRKVDKKFIILKSFYLSTYLIICLQAEHTIKCLTNRAFEMSTTYSKLQMLNKDLLRKKALLLPGN